MSGSLLESRSTDVNTGVITWEHRQKGGSQRKRFRPPSITIIKFNSENRDHDQDLCLGVLRGDLYFVYDSSVFVPGLG